MRPITASAASGGLAGVLLSLAKEAWLPEQWVEPLYLQTKESLGTSLLQGSDWDLKSLLVGIAIGFFLGPVLEFLVLLRQCLVIYLRRQISWLGALLAILEEAGADQPDFTVVEPATTASSSERGLVASEDRAGREQLARECGRFLKRAVAGVYRGSSGHERLKLANRIYVVLADFEGVRRSTPLVTESFAEVKEVCKRGSSAGNSVFLGFATKWEAEIAVQECILRFGEAGAETSVSVIPIIVVSGKLLAAVPFLTWHKTPSKRILPRDGLSRPVLVEIAVAPQVAEGDEPLEHIVKAWIGFLSGELAGSGVVGEPEEDTEIAEFGEELGLQLFLPEESLLSIADEHFAFVTAESGEATASAAKKKRSKQDLGRTCSHSGFVGLPEEQLARLASLAGHQPPLREVPKKHAPATNVLSESEEEEEEAALLGIGGSGGQSGLAMPPVEKAVVDLAKIVKSLQKEKTKKNGLEAILDQVEGGGSMDASSSQGGASRGKAAAYKKLKSALQENPEWIYTNIEALMDEDFNQMRLAPGSHHQPTTSRAWVEHRSKLLHYQSSIRATWLLAGIHDALKAGRTSEARARTALAILAYDQASLDNGNWQLAQELCLELAPPFSSFQNRKAPDSNGQSWSRLADERILDLALWRLKDKDSFNESRKRLSSQSKSARPGGGGDNAEGGGSKLKRTEVRASNSAPGSQSLPGSRASTVQANLFDEAFSRTSRARTPFSAFLHSKFLHSDFAEKLPKDRVWPMPLPYPEVHTKRRAKMPLDGQIKVGINYVVLVLNWLALQGRSVRCPSLKLGTKLNKQQWSAVRRIRPLISDWLACSVVTPEDMGRSAARVESIEALVARLESAASDIAAELNNYEKRSSKSKSRATLKPEWDAEIDEEVVGRLVGEGSAVDPADLKLPQVKVRCNKNKQLELVEKLDSVQRLQLIPGRLVRKQLLNGMFCLPKDQLRDRMILDARRPNAVESSEKRWIYSLGSSSQLWHLHLEQNEDLILHAEDLKEYYHCFIVPWERAIRNTLCLKFAPSQVSHLRCFKEELKLEDEVYASLNTLAMGDTNAVAYPIDWLR
eukprot:Skav225489  [mRNA]  locus=scaffold1360:5423:9203:- [translate_table: standard]